MIIHSIIMTYHRNQILTIYKLVIFTAVLIGITCCCNYGNSVFSMPVNEEESLSVDYTKFNVEEMKTAAAGYFDNAINEPDEVKRNQYLKNATTRYYILTNVEKDNPDNYIALGRIYDIRGLDKYAKAYFYNALGLDNKNPNANFYFAEFYYKRDKYKQALEYYKKALSYGYKGDSSEMLKKMGYMYEQYGDLDRALMYYKNSVSMKPDKDISKKIQDLNGANYSSTGYGKKRLRK